MAAPSLYASGIANALSTKSSDEITLGTNLPDLPTAILQPAEPMLRHASAGQTDGRQVGGAIATRPLDAFRPTDARQAQPIAPAGN